MRVTSPGRNAPPPNRERVSGVDDADMEASPGDDEGAAAVHPTLHVERLGGGDRSRAGGTGVAQAGQLRDGERLGRLRSTAPSVTRWSRRSRRTVTRRPVYWTPMRCCRPARLTRPVALTTVHLDHVARIGGAGGDRRWARLGGREASDLIGAAGAR